MVLSIVTPAFNESQNLPLLYMRLKKTMGKLRLPWEWIVVDDHSADETYRVMEKIAGRDKRVKAVRFIKNLGSHLALACGLQTARGQCVIGMAADLQDPPEAIGELLSKWREGAKVVWAVRGSREGESFSTVILAKIYYFIVRFGVGMKQIPPTGADFFLLDRLAVHRLGRSRIKNASLLLLISSFPFKQDYIIYGKQKRAHGRSGWSFRKKLKLFLDSITMFSKAPAWWFLGSGLALVTGGVFLLGMSGNLWPMVLIPLGLPLVFIGFFYLNGFNEDHLRFSSLIEKTTRSK